MRLGFCAGVCTCFIIIPRQYYLSAEYNESVTLRALFVCDLGSWSREYSLTSSSVLFRSQCLGNLEKKQFKTHLLLHSTQLMLFFCDLNLNASLQSLILQLIYSARSCVLLMKEELIPQVLLIRFLIIIINNQAPEMIVYESVIGDYWL